MPTLKPVLDMLVYRSGNGKPDLSIYGIQPCSFFENAAMYDTPPKLNLDTAKTWIEGRSYNSFGMFDLSAQPICASQSNAEDSQVYDVNMAEIAGVAKLVRNAFPTLELGNMIFPAGTGDFTNAAAVAAHQLALRRSHASAELGMCSIWDWIGADGLFKDSNYANQKARLELVRQECSKYALPMYLVLSPRSQWTGQINTLWLTETQMALGLEFAWQYFDGIVLRDDDKYGDPDAGIAANTTGALWVETKPWWVVTKAFLRSKGYYV